VPSIYEVPLRLPRRGDTLILKYLHKDAAEGNLAAWKDLVERCYHPKDHVSIAIVGKYVNTKTVISRLRKRSRTEPFAELKLDVTWIEAEGWSRRRQRTRL